NRPAGYRTGPSPARPGSASPLRAAHRASEASRCCDRPPSRSLRPEVADKAEQHARADLGIFGGDGFRWIVADAARATPEQQADIGEADQRHAVVPGAAH